MYSATLLEQRPECNFAASMTPSIWSSTIRPHVVRILCVQLLSILVLGACGGYRRPRPDLPPAEREATELFGLYEDFQRALGDGDLDRAEDILDELEKGVKEATHQTITHWTFARTSEGAASGRDKIRKARQQSNIVGIMGRGRGALESASQYVAVCAKGEPTSDTVEALEDAVEVLGEIKSDGVPAGAKEFDFQDFWKSLKLALPKLQQQARTCAWQESTNEDLRDIIPLEPEETEGMNTEAWKERAESLQKCVALLEERRREEGFEETARLQMPSVNMTLNEASAFCANEAAQAAGTVAQLRWVDSVAPIVEGVRVAHQAFLVDDSGARLRVLPSYLEALQRCAQLGTKEQEGLEVDWTHSFSTVFGPLDVAALSARCQQAANDVEASVPTLKWRAELEGLEVQAKDVFAKKPAERNEKDRVFLGLCMERTTALAKKAGYDDARPSRAEFKRAKNLWRQCNKRNRK